ncbi:anti-phage dCTP deaminase [Stenotrophomonas indicatrix]
MASPGKKPSLKIVAQGLGSDKNARETLEALESKELVLAFAGPIGSGLRTVVETFEAQLTEINYDVVVIKISELMSKISLTSQSGVQIPDERGMDRYEALQRHGNELRNAHGNDFLAYLCLREISVDRAARHPDQDVGSVTPSRVCYLIDQIKHPEEIELLRAVYGSNFFLIGALCGFPQRKQNLRHEGVAPTDAEILMDRDRKQAEKYGQKLEKTLQNADFFIRNARSNSKQLSAPVRRFLSLMHGKVGVTPTIQEQGMYAAYSAALGSACLSRQVGAAIQDKRGHLISVGCNDVPRGGGGLYREGDEKADHRCVHLGGGQCFNHREKDALRNEIQKISAAVAKKCLDSINTESGKEGPGIDSVGISRKLGVLIAAELRDESRVKDILEFSRSVHAEMDALIGLSRETSGSSQDGVLYTTTYPCHNCARHIVAAGIRAVYFIEPYEKSLAVELHGDAIDHGLDEEPSLHEWERHSRLKSRKVAFLHFEGVAPRRFVSLFNDAGERKDERTGKAIAFVPRDASKRSRVHLEGYIEIESRVVQLLEKKFVDGMIFNA